MSILISVLNETKLLISTKRAQRHLLPARANEFTIKKVHGVIQAVFAQTQYQNKGHIALKQGITKDLAQMAALGSPPKM